MSRDTTIDPREVEYYTRMAETWWDRDGPFWPLHRLNELRLEYIRDRLCRHFGLDATAGRLMSYAGLRYYQQTTDAARTKFLSDMQDRITTFTTPLVFFTLELNRLDEGLVYMQVPGGPCRVYAFSTSAVEAASSANRWRCWVHP